MMNRSEALIRALWMVDNHLLDRKIDKNDIKFGILVRMEAFRFYDDRIADDEAERILSLSDGIMDYSHAVNEAVFELHQGLPVIRVERLSQALCRIIDPDSQLCLYRDLYLPHDEAFDWAALSIRDGHFSNSVLNNGSVDTHIHLGGALPPLFYWLILMSGEIPANVVSDYAQKRRGYIKAEFWREAITEAIWTRLLLAREIQRLTDGEAFPYLPPVTNEQWKPFTSEHTQPTSFAKVRDLIAAFSAEQHQYLPKDQRCWPFWDPLRFDCVGDGSCHYAVGERRLLYYVGRFLQGPNAKVEQLLLRYLRIKNAFHQLLTHDHGTDGLMRFMESFARRGFYFGTADRTKRHRRMVLDLERSRMTAALDSQLRDAFMFEKQKSSALMPIRRIEMRVSLTENKFCLRTVDAWLKGIIDHVQAHHSGQDEGFLYRSQVGLLFHLGKSRAKSYQTDYLLSEKAFHSARKLACILKDYPQLRNLVIGLDAAGEERVSSPRLFIEAYDKMRETQQKLRPKAHHHPIRLGWTFHVGEDFADLVTALRHIDEVCCLLFKQEGGRLGHALALSESPKRFYLRRQGQVEKKLGSHLLDLVWARGCLIEAHETAYISWLEAQISDRLDGEEREQQIHKCFQKMDLTLRFEQQLLESDLLSILGFHGNAEQIITLEANQQWINLSIQLQKLLRQRIAFKRICIEANPTSNLIIGGFSGYEELPYQNLVDDNLAVSLNTDDPGLFLSSLPWEYSAMYGALTKHEGKKFTHKEILNWLNDRLFDAQQSSFLNNHVPISLQSVKGLFNYQGDQ